MQVQTLRSRCLDFRNFSIDSSAQLPAALIDTVTVLATSESNVSALVADAKVQLLYLSSGPVPSRLKNSINRLRCPRIPRPASELVRL
jgi:hypothetical protein